MIWLNLVFATAACAALPSIVQARLLARLDAYPRHRHAQLSPVERFRGLMHRAVEAIADMFPNKIRPVNCECIDDLPEGEVITGQSEAIDGLPVAQPCVTAEVRMVDIWQNPAHATRRNLTIMAASRQHLSAVAIAILLFELWTKSPFWFSKATSLFLVAPLSLLITRRHGYRCRSLHIHAAIWFILTNSFLETLSVHTLGLSIIYLSVTL